MLLKELDSAIKIAKEAGKAVALLYEKEAKITKMKDGSPVTSADEISEDIILNGIKEYGYPVISEESKKPFFAADSEDKVWIIDPLDGTKDFINKTRDFAIMVGMIEKGELVIGVVYQPIGEKLYFAEKGKGAYFQAGKNNPERLKVSKKNNLKKTRFLASRHHTTEWEKAFIEKHSKEKIKYKGSLGLKLGIIAQGLADAYINFSDKTNQWDTCAPQIIIKEAGGEITDIEGRALKYGKGNNKNLKGIVAGNKIIHSKIIKVLKKELCRI